MGRFSYDDIFPPHPYTGDDFKGHMRCSWRTKATTPVNKRHFGVGRSQKHFDTAMFQYRYCRQNEANDTGEAATKVLSCQIQLVLCMNS